MRKADVYLHARHVGVLEEREYRENYVFTYDQNYQGPPISVAMPVRSDTYEYDRFPPFFDGLLPEGIMLEGLLRQHKIDRGDCFSQLVAVGLDMVGAVTVEESK